MRSIKKDVILGFCLGFCFFLFCAGAWGPSALAAEEKFVPEVIKSGKDAFDLMAHYREIADKYKDDGTNEIVLKNGIVFHPFGYEYNAGALWLMFKGQVTEPDKFEMGFILPLMEVDTINKKAVDPLEANFGMATYYLNEGKDFNKAIDYLEKTLALDPEYKSALIDLGSAYNYAGRFADSVLLGERAVGLYPDEKKLWFNLAVAYMKENQLSRAEESYNKAIAIDPDFTQAYMNMGVLYSGQGRLKEAQTKFKKARSLLFGESVELSSMTRQEALKVVDESLGVIENILIMDQGLEMARAGKYKEARENFEEASWSGRADFQKGYCLIVLDDLKKGILSAEYGQYFFQGLIDHRKQDYDKARVQFEKALELNNKVPHAQFFLGLEYVSLDQKEKARPYLEEAVTLKPDFAEALWGLAALYEELGETVLARETYEKAKAIFVAQKKDQIVKTIDDKLLELSK